MTFGETTHLDHLIWGVTTHLGSEYTIDATNEGDTMAEKKADEQVVYKIRVQGKLDDHWADWFDGLEIVVESIDPPVTILTGTIDQSGLRGILNKVWDLNLALISVRPVKADGALGEVGDEN
jgi:hypothetical protein